MDLVVYKKDQFEIMNPEVDIKELIEMNLDGEDITPGMLDRVKVPAGGATQWAIPDDTEEGGERYEKVIRGVIIYSKMGRTFWKCEQATAGTPPDCVSDDCIHGVGDPGGFCEQCPYAQFGSAKGGEGQGQACKKKRMIAILTEQSILPLILYVPPTSLKDMTKYLLSLSTRHKLPRHAVITEFSLVKDRNPNGNDYSRIVPRIVGKIDDPAAILQYAEMIKPILEKTSIIEEQEPIGANDDYDQAAA